MYLYRMTLRIAYQEGVKIIHFNVNYRYESKQDYYKGKKRGKKGKKEKKEEKRRRRRRKKIKRERQKEMRKEVKVRRI